MEAEEGMEEVVEELLHDLKDMKVCVGVGVCVGVCVCVRREVVQ